MTAVFDPVGVLVGDREIALPAGPVGVGSLEIGVWREVRAGGQQLRLTVGNRSRRALALPDIGVAISAHPSWILEHGWQSWSVVRRCRPTDLRPARAGLPRWLRAMLLADPDGAGLVLAGDQFLISDLGLVGFLGGSSHLGVVRCRPGRLEAVALLDGAELRPGEQRQLEPLWIAAGAPARLYRTWLDLWAEHDHARAAGRSALGWCSWYQYQAGVLPSDVDRNLPQLAAHGFQVAQIDDGFQARVGDWLDPRPGWEGGLVGLAQAAATAGLTPGIWTAPFLAVAASHLEQRHPDWLVRDPDGDPLRVAWNPSWGGWAHALDTTRPRVLAHLRHLFAQLRGLGYRYFKVDFCYAAGVAGQRQRAVTRAEALRSGLAAIRAGIGEDSFLLASGCPLGPAVGLVDAMRVSPDTGPVWGRGEGDRLQFPEPAPGLRFAAEASLLRAPMHRRLWINDPDCLLVRPFDTALTAAERTIGAALVAGTGGLMTVSDDTCRYRTSEWDLIAQLWRFKEVTDRRSELLDPFAAVLTVRTDRSRLEVDCWGSTRPRGRGLGAVWLASPPARGAPWAVLRGNSNRS
jgi:alpha-galactosidase